MISLKENNLYGRTLYYPVCSLAKAICAIANKKSLTMKDLKIFKDFQIEVEISN